MTRADISPQYYWRFAFISTILLGLAGWSLYDGIVAWPNQRVRALKYLEIKEANPDDYKERWSDYATEQGWSTEWPEEPKTEADIAGQFVMAALAGPIGLLTLAIFLRSLGQWVEMDENGVRTSRGREARFEEMTLLDKKKWQKKGIAKLHFERDGRTRKLILDDYKFDRAATGVIIRQVEEALGEERIVNGSPEPPLDDAEMEQPLEGVETSLTSDGVAAETNEPVADREAERG